MTTTMGTEERIMATQANPVDVNARFDARAAALVRRGFRYGKAQNAEFASFTRKNKSVDARRVMRADDSEWESCLAELDQQWIIVRVKESIGNTRIAETVERVFTTVAAFNDYVAKMAEFDAMNEIVGYDLN